jgi:3-hydroxy-9,10-secoandrosta-1,3,5(10)-triene-9,17-dione monooxygenase
MSAAEILSPAASPSRDELLDRTRALLPAIAARRDEADRIRDIPHETMAEIVDAGLMRVFQPARWSGYETDPRTFFAIQSLIAEACPSTAWVYGVLCVQSLLIGRQAERIQADVWEADERALACSSFAPTGQAEPVEGGYRLSGRWTFSSGSSFAQWALVGARIAGGPPAPFQLFLVPRADYEIKDVWNTFGLRGTGSNDLIGRDIFVPAHRFVQLDPGLQNLTGPAGGRLSALYRMPWFYVFGGVISNFAIGAARSALRALIEAAHTRVQPYTGQSFANDPATIQGVARMLGELEIAEAMYERHVARQLDYVARDEPIPMPETLLYRAQLSSQLGKIAERMNELMRLQGSRATDVGSLVTRNWLDLNAALAHAGNNPAMAGGMLGSAAMGGGVG